ncbi:MAG: hypothetical protein E6G50_04240 [Actinobacteria bacterium]|nr:MAG: hypothetical protein E6G50_04240 [Actinomycetota bacterium]
MAASEAANTQETDAVRSELAGEREHLADAIDELRQSADLNAQLRAKLPLLLVGAFAVGFVLSGGVGATMRLFFRRGREGRTAARAGRYALVRR